MMVNEWFMQDQQMELTDDAIADMVTNPHNVADDDTDEIVDKISHSDGLKAKALEAALAYIEQQEESTPADVLHLQRPDLRVIRVLRYPGYARSQLARIIASLLY
ncbi:hypothetical protein J6590_041287 [Homalodisca vitripennis]|nr:hypothetical protein J6590_041287 [Homalodisca vitripennis]